MSQKEKLIKKYTTYPLPVEVDFVEFMKYLEMNGFKRISFKGSHHIFYQESSEVVISIPTVNGKIVKSSYVKLANEIIYKKRKK